MMNADCSHASNQVKALKALTASFKKLSSLGRNDPRLIPVFEVILHGTEAELDADELATLVMVGVPRELYQKAAPARRNGARTAKRALRKCS